MNKKLKVLVACEESQVVCKAFRKQGHEAYSCDIEPCSGNHPEWHIQDDVLKHLDDGWDMIIAFPPCTHLACSGARYFKEKRKDGRQQKGINFFMQFTKLKCRFAIENPIGIMSTYYRKPDQIIQPYQFGDPHMKSTCLWLNGLPKLIPTNIVEPEMTVYKNSGKPVSKHHYDTFFLPKKERAKARSKTFPGIAEALATQYIAFIKSEMTVSEWAIKIGQKAMAEQWG